MTDKTLEQRAREAADRRNMDSRHPTSAETPHGAYMSGYLAAARKAEQEIAALKARQTAKEILDTGGEWRELTDREIELLTMAVMPDLLEEDQRPGRDRLARLVCKAHELLSRARDKELEIAVLKARVAELEADASAVAIQEKRMYLSLPEDKG